MFRRNLYFYPSTQVNHPLCPTEQNPCYPNPTSQKNMKIIIVAALDEHCLIGNKNSLPWHLPADLQHFKTTTLNKPIIMGRKTFESIGKPLPQRRNIIISRTLKTNNSNCAVFTSLQNALVALADQAEVMIIGGAEIYKQALPIADKMYLTIIHHTFEGDIYFPKWNTNEWQETARKDFAADKDNPYAFSFVTFERKRKS